MKQNNRLKMNDLRLEMFLGDIPEGLSDLSTTDGLLWLLCLFQQESKECLLRIENKLNNVVVRTPSVIPQN